MFFTVMATRGQMELEIEREWITDAVAKRRAGGKGPDGRRRTFTDSQDRNAAGPRMHSRARVCSGARAGRSPEDFLTELAEDAVVFALANPDPESMPDIAAQHASVVATDRWDFPNQIHNLLAFPRIFRGALGAGVRRIAAQTKVEATKAITGIVAADGLPPDHIMLSTLDDRAAPAMAEAVATCGRDKVSA